MAPTACVPAAMTSLRALTRKGAFILFVPIVIVMIVIDRLSKAWAVDALPLGAGPQYDLGLVRLVMVHNYGAAFGMGQGNAWVFIIIAAVIFIGIIAWLVVGKEHGKLETVALALVAAGAIGNVIDRVAQSYVVDFFEFTFIDFPVFNVADICVTVGVALFLICVIFLMGDDDAKEGKQPASEAGDAQ